MPTITQIEYIIAVDRLKHFGKAADQCHVTQPTLSMQIQKVEEEIGYLLFDRLKKPVVATKKGIRFIEQARVLLREHQKLVDLSKNQASEVSGDFRLGVIPTVAPYLLPYFIEKFSVDFPKVKLIIDEMRTDTIISRLHDDYLDGGLLATPLHEPGFRERPLYYEPFSLYVAEDHPLNSRKRIRDDDLDAADMWLLEDGHCLRSQIVKFCSLKNTSGVFPNVQFEGGNLDTLRNLVRRSRGYTLIPALMIETFDVHEKRKFVREFERPAPSREISLIFRRDQWKKDVIQALIQTITAAVPKNLVEMDAKKLQVLEVKLV